MAVTTGTALIGGSLLGAGASAYSANKAAKAQRRASKNAIASNNAALERIIGLGATQREAGDAAVNQLRSLLIDGDMSQFTASPDFEFVRGEGLEGIAQTLGAGGSGAFSGNALRSLNQFNNNLASGEFSNFINRRLGLAGMGQTANMNAQNAIGGTAANNANALMAGGNARASGILGQGLAVNNGIRDILDVVTLSEQGLI